VTPVIGSSAECRDSDRLNDPKTARVAPITQMRKPRRTTVHP
jgi:hypothetical protein